MPQRNRFEFLESQPTGSTDTEPDTGQKPPMSPAESPQAKVVIPGLDKDTPEKEVLERLNIEIPADLHQRLKLYCAEKKRTKKDVINTLIAWFLENEAID